MRNESANKGKADIGLEVWVVLAEIVLTGFAVFSERWIHQDYVVAFATQVNECKTTGGILSKEAPGDAGVILGPLTILLEGIENAAMRDGRMIPTSRSPSWTSPPCFKPRAPCGARRESCNLGEQHERFNPRAPCGARRPTAISLTVQPQAPSEREPPRRSA